MSKFLLMSGGGDGLGVALRLKHEGNDVAVWVKEGRAKSNYDGLLRKVKRWDEFLSPETVVIFDSNGGGRTAERLRSRGHYVLNGGLFSDQLEMDRPLALELMQQAGVRVPPYETFTDYESAAAYVRKKDQPLVFKANGKMADYTGTYKSFDAPDMIEMLAHIEKSVQVPPDFMLQDVVKGIEVSSEGWFNGDQWMVPWNHTIERKSVMNGNLGGSAGCSGNIVWCTMEPTEVHKKGIELMGPILREHEYIGPIDLNSIVNEEGVWGLEFTPRFGYDAFPALLELFEAPLGETLESLAQGKRPSHLPLKSTLAAGLRLSIPPYPSEKFGPIDGIPIRGFVKEDRPHLYFFDVKLSADNHLINSGAYGVIVTLTGTGDSIPEALEGPMELAKRAKVADKQYRTDLVEEFVRQRAELQAYLVPEKQYEVA